MLYCRALPAAAQYANEFVPAKLLQQGEDDGRHRRQRHGDRAGPSQCRRDPQGDQGIQVDATPATTPRRWRSPKTRPTARPIAGRRRFTAFYDFTLKFTGKSVANSESGRRRAGGRPQPGGGSQVAALIRAKGDYAPPNRKRRPDCFGPGRRLAARRCLGSRRSTARDVDDCRRGVRQGTHGRQAVSSRPRRTALRRLPSAWPQDNPAQSLAYAQKAVALNPDTNSRFALGTAQLANKQNADAVRPLKGVRDSAMKRLQDPKSTKVNIDARLMSAYLANNDSPAPRPWPPRSSSSTRAARCPGAFWATRPDKVGRQRGDGAEGTTTALKNFDLAAAQGDPEVAVTANTASGVRNYEDEQAGL